MRGRRSDDFLRRARDPFSSANREVVGGWMAVMGDRLADRTVKVARSWGPDLVVSGPISPVGSLAAALLDVPLVIQGFDLHSPLLPISAAVERAMRGTIERHGLEGPLLGPAAAIDTCPQAGRSDGRRATSPTTVVARCPIG
jgi:hypothetical protein